MSIDKSIKQNYAIQGGGPNYLGKQKMVKAPKKWKSSPDHEPAELAYITKKEKDILLDLNIYGSLKNGKPNRGPSGIMSLQGDMGSTSGGGGGGGGDNYDDWNYTPASAPEPTIDTSSEDNEDDVARMMSDMGLTPDNAPTGFQNTTGEDGLGGGDYVDSGKSLYVDTTDDRPSGTWTYAGPKPTFTPSSDSIYSTPTINPDADDENKSLSYIQPIEKPKTGFWNSGLGKILKGALPFLAGPLAGLVGLQKPYQMYSTINQAKKGLGYADRITKGKYSKNIDSLKEILNPNIDFKSGSGGKGPTGFTGNGDNGDNTLATLVAGKGDVISKAVNQFTGTEAETQIASLVKNDLNKALQFYTQMKPNIEADKASQQEMDAYELLEKYLVQTAPTKQDNRNYI